MGNLLYAKARGGLGILNLQLFNKALLAKWFWKLEIESGLWQEVLLSKYVKGKCIYGIKPKVVDSHFYQHVKRKIGDDKNTRFWEDWWVGSKPLKEAYPSMYFTCFDHNISVAEAIEKGWHNFSFRKTLYGESLDLWDNLKERCEEVIMHGGKDEPLWMLALC